MYILLTDPNLLNGSSFSPLVSSGMTMGGVRSGSSSSPACSPVARRRFKSRKSGTSTEISVEHKKDLWRKSYIWQKYIYCMLIHPEQTLGIIPFQTPCQNFAPPQNRKLSLIPKFVVQKTSVTVPSAGQGKSFSWTNITPCNTDSLFMQAIMMHCSTCTACDGLNCTREHVIGRHRWQTSTWHINKSALAGAGWIKNKMIQTFCTCFGQQCVTLTTTM